ncbi:MAG: UDP-N-acetylmuramate dehydrogenase [Peptococcaceae bacterium]|nr:UDP-N-acetylmuramate dehydrogenase [Peptococcaceae bacterium]
MDIASFLTDLQSRFQGDIFTEEPMKKHTTWKIGGKADVLVRPYSEADLQAIFTCANRYEIPFYVIGKGSNLLVTDGGIRGVVIEISADEFQKITIQDDGTVLAGAGVSMARLAKETLNHNLAGLGWSAGIPGSLGGAVMMNAGAYGYHIGSYVTKINLVEYIGSRRQISKAEADFSYRHSGLMGQPWVVTEVALRLVPQGDVSGEIQQMKDWLKERAAKQPLDYPSAGSVFKNPEGSHAGYLVEQAGCRGMQVGDAQVSTKHGNFIVNLGNASASDVLSLIEKVRERVLQNSGHKLELEVRILGE